MQNIFWLFSLFFNIYLMFMCEVIKCLLFMQYAKSYSFKF